jgi:hypothetical protein
MEKFQKATSQPFGCLVVDLKQDTPDQERLKSGNMFNQKEETQSRPGSPTCSNMQGDYGQAPEPLNCGGDLTPGHLQAGRQAVNISREEHSTMNSCKHCGKIFKTPYFLDMHQQIGCDMLVEDSEDDDPSAWDELVNASYRKHNGLYGEKMEDLQEEEDMDEHEADSKVSHELRPKYCRSLIQLYKKFLNQTYDLGRNSHHREIMRMVYWYKVCKGYEFDKALDITLRKKRHLFEVILDEAQEAAEAAAEDDDNDGDDSDDADDDGDDDSEDTDDDDEDDDTTDDEDVDDSSDEEAED